MAAPSSTDNRDTPATSVRFCNEVFDQVTGALGAETEDDRARLCDVDRSTLHRYRTGKTVPLLPAGMRFASRIGLTVADLWQAAA